MQEKKVPDLDAKNLVQFVIVLASSNGSGRVSQNDIKADCNSGCYILGKGKYTIYNIKYDY